MRNHSTRTARLKQLLLGAALAATALAGLPQHEGMRVQAAADRLMASREQLGLDGQHGFELRRAHSDRLGQTHGHFVQTYKGVKVWGGDVITHTDREGGALPLTNALHGNIALNVTPALAAAEALAAVQADLLPRGTYSAVPTSELVVYPLKVASLRRQSRRAAELEPNAEEVVQQVLRYTLAYHIHTELENDLDGIRHTDHMIDAHTGAILEKWDDLHSSAATGTGRSQYSGVVALNTNRTASGYELRDMTRGVRGAFGNNVVTDAAHAATSSSAAGSVYTAASNEWGDGANYAKGGSTTGANGQTAAVDALYGMSKTWDFFLNVFGRNGIDNAGTATYSRVHIGTSYDNAFWSDSCFCMTYGDGSSFRVLTTLDVAGHEMSHGVCSATANLNYSGESGGLNEANSDILGTMVEFYARGGSGATIGNTGGNWTIGEQLSGTPLRYMYKPSLDGSSPDAWSASLGSLDVHYSSGPMNRCFYFLSQGATASGSTSSTYLPAGMNGLGNDKAAAIWYRALTTYLTSSSNYAAARTAAINASRDLYGAGSAEEQAVWNAFAAVNVGARWTAGPPSITGQPASLAGAVGTAATFTVIASSGGPMNYQWKRNGVAIPGAVSSSYSIPSLALADNGSLFSVTVGNSYGSVTSSSASLSVGSAPVITSQPANATALAGQKVTFTVSAASSSTLAYQWQKGGAAIPGATSATYALAGVTVADGGSQFTVVVTNRFGATTSASALLTVAAPPAITGQPASTSVIAGAKATFSVAAVGSGPLSYQWKRNGQVIPGATAATYVAPGATSADNGSLYSVLVTNAFGSTPSAGATLTVTAMPSITTQPAGTAVVSGRTATFSVVAAGSGTLVYQWRKGGVSIPGANAATYTTPAATLADNGAVFSVLVINSLGTATSGGATLTVTAPPSILSQPASASVVAGKTATFTVTAAGTGPLSYQWRKGGAAIPGATAASYTTAATTLADNAGLYSVTVSNGLGSVSSGSATLTVLAPPTITGQPVSATVSAGRSATFSVTATGSGAIVYQWKKSGVSIVGANAASYTTPAATPADHGSVYTVMIITSVGTVTSNGATLSVAAAPSIASHPASTSAGTGQAVTFRVTATGSGTLSYQWLRNGVAIPGATAATYTIPATSSSQNGSLFSVSVTNSYGSATSSVATLRITA